MRPITKRAEATVVWMRVAAFTILCVVSLSYTDPWAWSGCRRATVR